MQEADFKPGIRGNRLAAYPPNLYQVVVKERVHLWLVVLAVFIHSALPLLADGKMYAEKVNTEIPYQRALILFDEEKEMLVLQSQYQIPGEPGHHTLGWVVPVPAVPEIASMDASKADWLFGRCSELSASETTYWRTYLLFGLFILAAGLGVVTIPAAILSFLIPGFARHRAKLGRLAMVSTIGICFVILVAPFMVRQAKGIGGVEVIKSGKVGIFDTKVVRSDSPKELIAWLNENSFRFDDNDEKTVQSYIDRKWCFVTAKVDASVVPSDGAAVSRKLLAPLILLFPTPNPVYPTALTATGGRSTEILIYLLTKEPFKTDSALECKFRGAVKQGSIMSQLTSIDLESPDAIYEFIENEWRETNHLSKFKATLTPAQMAKDIEFLPDPGAQPYREHIYRW